VRELRKQVKAWRKTYEPVYGEVRDHLAHNKQGVSEIDPFLAKTNIDEMKRMFGFSSNARTRSILAANNRSDRDLAEAASFSSGSAPKNSRFYVAAVVDLFSRRVVGWSMNAAITAQLITDALVMAIWRWGNRLAFEIPTTTAFGAFQFTSTRCASNNKPASSWSRTILQAAANSFRAEK
jgi:transposase InsO family protein